MADPLPSTMQTMTTNNSNSAEGANEYHLLLACPSGIPTSLLEVEFSAEYDRQPHPGSALEATIESTWEGRLAKQSSLFNASKFRYGGYKIITGSEEMKWATSVCLHLGLTDYKTFIGTNLCPEWERFLVSDVGKSPELCDIEDVDRCKHTASPLGNGAIVKTADDHIVVLQRGTDVGEFPGHPVFPGGHSEPDDLGIKGHIHLDSETEMESLKARLVKEMYEGITREVVEETGIPAPSLSEPLFIGISRRAMNVRPTAFFYIKCSLTSSQVQEFYQQAGDAYESSNLLLVSQDDLLGVAENMPGCHNGGAALYDLARKLLD